eukprot:scaffold14224_cov96-Isochrysis_galbana.AAC.1
MGVGAVGWWHEPAPPRTSATSSAPTTTPNSAMRCPGTSSRALAATTARTYAPHALDRTPCAERGERPEPKATCAGRQAEETTRCAYMVPTLQHMNTPARQHAGPIEANGWGAHGRRRQILCPLVLQENWNYDKKRSRLGACPVLAAGGGWCPPACWSNGETYKKKRKKCTGALA